MPQTITITVGEKIASTDFKEVVSFNSDYLLHFDLDGDWEEFTHRVAVVIWADGCTETRFDGTDCAFPTVSSAVADSVLVGVYAANETRKIASTFVRLRCRAGAHAVPAEKPAASLHEQILSFLNEKDWSIFRDKVKEGMYSAVRVSKQGIVIEGRQVIEVGAIGQTKPGDSLMFGGIFIRRSADGKAEIFHYTQSGGTALTLAECAHSESADTAETATNANHAETADTATNATNAAHAVSADTATKAEQDSNGASIPETYATKSELQSKISEENAAWKAESSKLGIRIDDIEKGETLVGHANHADTATGATNAGHAVSADTAETATNATHAVSADTAVNANEAVHAQTADSADKVTHRLNVFRDGVLLAEYDGSEQIVIDLPSNDGGIAEKVSHKLTAKVNATTVTYDGSAEVTIPTVFAPNSGGTYGYFLKSNGSSVAPVWSKLPLTGTSGARAVNGSSVSVTHGLGESPAEIFLQLYSPSNKGTNYYVTSKSSTTFTVSFYSSGTAGAQSITGTLYWMALS